MGFAESYVDGAEVDFIVGVEVSVSVSVRIGLLESLRQALNPKPSTPGLRLHR